MTTPAKRSKKSTKTPNLLTLHRDHAGLYKRVASRLGVDASYVSRVANGERKSASIMHELRTELSRLYKQSLRI